MNQKIILVGGTSGVGKSSLSIQMCKEFDIPHKISTGFIREIVRNITGNKKLGFYTFDLNQKNSGYAFLLEQTELLKDSINVCINRAFKEGTGLVVEGTHVLPWVINNKYVTDSFILYVEDEYKHRKMIEGNTHSKRRKYTNEEFHNVRKIQEEIIELAVENNINLKEVYI